MLLVLKLPKGSRIPQKGFETAKVQITSQIYLMATCYHCVSMLSRFSCVPLFVTLWTGLWPTGSSVHGILQARLLEWVAITSSRGSSQPRDQTHISYICFIGRQVLYH